MKRTEAYKIERERRRLLKTHRITTKSILTPINLCCAAYIGWDNKTGQWCFIGFRGRSKRIVARHAYATRHLRDKAAQDFVDSEVTHYEARQPLPRTLEVGDVLKCSWGYDQTNVDYYIVLELIGKTSVKIAEIGKKNIESTGLNQGTCMPDPSNIIGEPMVKKCRGDSVRIDNGQFASKTDINEKSYWSSYA